SMMFLSDNTIRFAIGCGVGLPTDDGTLDDVGVKTGTSPDTAYSVGPLLTNWYCLHVAVDTSAMAIGTNGVNITNNTATAISGFEWGVIGNSVDWSYGASYQDVAAVEIYPTYDTGTTLSNRVYSLTNKYAIH